MSGSLVTSAVALAGAAIALLFLPARPREEEPVSITLEGEPAGPVFVAVLDRVEA